MNEKDKEIIIFPFFKKLKKDIKTIKEGTDKKKKMVKDIDKEMGW